MKQLRQLGFALFESLIIIGVIAIVALAGWNIYQRNQKSGATTATKVEKTIEAVPVAPAVTTASDLDEASQTLDQTSLDSNADTAQLDEDLASF